MEKLNLMLPDNKAGEIIIREGEALPVEHAKGIKISGTLGAPFQFYEGKKAALNAIDCHIQVRKDVGSITLYLNDTHPHTEHIITGSLSKDSALASWKINTEKRWTITEFLKHIKTQAYYFASKDEFRAIVESLQTWDAKVETIMKNHNANTGNSLASLEKKVSEINLKNTFRLRMPIFQGYPSIDFDVEIGLDPKANEILLFLLSDDLFTFEIENREKLIAVELDHFKDFPCSKVVLS